MLTPSSPAGRVMEDSMPGDRSSRWVHWCFLHVCPCTVEYCRYVVQYFLPLYRTCDWIWELRSSPAPAGCTGHGLPSGSGPISRPQGPHSIRYHIRDCKASADRYQSQYRMPYPRGIGCCTCKHSRGSAVSVV